MALPLKPTQDRRCPGPLLKLFERQSSESDSRRMYLVSSIQSNQQSREGFDDARIFQFSAIQRPGAGNFCGEFARNLSRSFVVAAHKDVAIDWPILAEQFRAHIVKGRSDRYRCGHKFASLLRCGALPHAEHPRWRSADSRRKRHSSVNQNLPSFPAGLELLQERGVPGKRHRKDDQLTLRDRSCIVRALNFRGAAKPGTKKLGCLCSALRVPGPNDDVFTGSSPTHCKPGAFRPSSAENSDFSAHDLPAPRLIYDCSV